MTFFAVFTLPGRLSGATRSSRSSPSMQSLATALGERSRRLSLDSSSCCINKRLANTKALPDAAAAAAPRRYCHGFKIGAVLGAACRPRHSPALTLWLLLSADLAGQPACQQRLFAWVLLHGSPARLSAAKLPTPITYNSSPLVTVYPSVRRSFLPSYASSD